jgi:glutamine amidotransferase
MITIVDYGLGNISAFANVYNKLNISIEIATNKEQLSNASKVILPGVGAFDHAMQQLDQSGMRETLDELILGKKLPVIGICVGMQMLAGSSEEGKLPGLGWIDGEVKKFGEGISDYNMLLPHMGWNDVRPLSKNNLFRDFDDDPSFYFLHSFYFHCHKEEDILAQTDYGDQFTCAVNSGNIYGVQFHPEKSHQHGIQLLKNFANL